MAPRLGSPGHLESSTVTLTGPRSTSVMPATGRGSRARRTTGPATRGWSAAIAVAGGTQMVGLTWDSSQASTSASLQVRSRLGDVWSQWQPADAEPDEGPDRGGNGRAGTDLMWLGSQGADRVEVKVDSGNLPNLELSRMRWIEPTPGSGGQAHADAVGPGIRPRSDWAPGGWKSQNADCGKTPPVADKLKFAVVHHTVNANNYTASQVPGILAGIYRYHTGSKGWCDIAYNFLIDRFGTVWQGRSGDINTPVIGGHAKGFNTGSVGIALLGQYDPGGVPTAAKPSADQVYALESVLAWKLSIHQVDPTATVSVVSGGSSSIPAGKTVSIPTISGHRNVSSTSCPGGNVYSLLPAIRTDVAALIAKAGTPVSPKPFATPQAAGNRQYQDFLGRPATNGEQGAWASRMQRDKTGPASLIAGLLDSNEFADGRAPVVRLYLAYFGRVPDHGGLNHWLDALRGGSSRLDDMSSAFAGSSEFERQYGSLDSKAFVDRVYRNVLGRPPETSGLAYWTDQIEKSGKRRGAVMIGFSESNENRRITTDRVDVITVYDAMLGRAASTASYDQWVAKLRAGGSIEELIAQAYSGGEYSHRIAALG